MHKTLKDLPEHIANLFRNHPVSSSIRRQPKVYTDTSNFSSIDYGDIIAADNRYFVVTGHTVEGRFGVDDQPKQWVPKVIDLESGVSHIIKLVFHEVFSVSVGAFTIPCYRSPEKEARILELTQDHVRFMKGRVAEDEAGNLVRILDIISGRRLDKHIFRNECTHREYFENYLPAILREYVECAKAIGFLHQAGFRHGDIRRDHILVEYGSGMFRWIDFDYEFYLPERPFALDLFELGNLLMYLVVRGNYHPKEISDDPLFGPRMLETLTPDDFSLLSRNRLVNLQKLFPYIPTPLNNIFMHFSQEASVWYDTVDELVEDVEQVVAGHFA
ncbi:MAG: serine/threonine protein kinase [Deltaproteobacteria bacterium]|nr:serine/threonine protein kinase [Deltaproteobacteria bacterium]